jgi:NO-binding membrane sensor protein with MHYT domain
MHFMAMIGFTVPGQPLRYDIPLTIASWITAITVVAIGLFIVGFGRPRPAKIFLAGLITGFGVAGMHYTGMAAMHVPAHVNYDHNLVIASIAIAVVAATVALWFTVTLTRGWAIAIAALIMGVAVAGMHYTAMYALRVSGVVARPIEGMLPSTFLVPIVIFVVAVLAVLMVSLLNRRGADGVSDATVRLATSAVAIPNQAVRSTPSAFVRRR